MSSRHDKSPKGEHTLTDSSSLNSGALGTEDTISQATTEEWQSFFSQRQWCLFAIIIGAGLLLRWIGLGDRPLHHDESLYATWSKYYFDEPFSKFYKYDPILHGPLMFHIVPLAYTLFGVSDWSARFFPALFGSIILLMPFLFRRFWTPTSVLVLTAALATSPSLTYWSRFLREDHFVLFGIVVTLWGIFRARPALKPAFYFAGIALQFAAKENSFVHAALLLGYVVFESLVVAFQGTLPNRQHMTPLWRQGWNFTRRQPWAICFGLLFGLFVALVLYTAMFQYYSGILDGLYRKSLVYWWQHHSMERITGPFLLTFYTLSWYESVLLAAICTEVFFFYRHSPHWARYIAVLTIAAGLASALTFGDKPSEAALLHFFKLKDWRDVLGLFVLLVHPVIVTLTFLQQGNQRLAVTGYFFWATFFTYCYLGEKVPWLAMYPTFGALIYLSCRFDTALRSGVLVQWQNVYATTLLTVLGATLMALGIEFFIEGLDRSRPLFEAVQQSAQTSAYMCAIGLGIIVIAAVNDFIVKAFDRIALLRICAILGLSFNLWQNLMTSHGRAGLASEFISQVHTTRELRDLALTTRKAMEMPLFWEAGAKDIQVLGEAIWPLTWYFRDLAGYRFFEEPGRTEPYRYMIKDHKDEPAPPGYHKERINLRGWWVPDYTKMGLKEYLWYAIAHKPWGVGDPTGYQYADFFVRAK